MKTIKAMSFLMATAILGGFTLSAAHADDTVKEKASEAANDTKRGVKKGARAVQDKTCEMVNGKMECAAKKVKHSIQNGADNVEDAID